MITFDLFSTLILSDLFQSKSNILFLSSSLSVTLEINISRVSLKSFSVEIITFSPSFIFWYMVLVSFPDENHLHKSYMLFQLFDF